MTIFTERVLERLERAGASDGVVASLCRLDATTWAPVIRPLIDHWCTSFNPPKKLISELTGADESSFWASFAELRTAAALHALGFEVDMRASFGNLTPDIVARKHGLTTIVEVMSVTNDQKTEREAAELRRVATLVQERLKLPPGLFVSLSAIRPLVEQVREETVAELARIVQAAVDSGNQRIDAYTAALPILGTVMPGGETSTVSLTQAGGSIGQAARIGPRLSDKIQKYAHLSSDEVQLTVAVNPRGWKVTSYGVQTALLGSEVVTLSRDDPDHNEAAFSGEGVLISTSALGAANASALSGVWFLEGLWSDGPPRQVLDVSFMHNPWSDFPLPDGFAGQISELRRSGDAMYWHRPEGLQSLVLGTEPLSPNS